MTWARDKSDFLAVIKALKASMPPYNAEYRGGLRPSRIAGRCFSASSSQVVTCATMSLTDHAFVTPGTRRTDSGKPAYESLNASHSLSSCLRSRCLLSTFVSICRDAARLRLPSSSTEARRQQTGGLFCVVENHSDRVAATRAQAANAVPKVHAVDAARPANGTVADSEHYAVAAAQGHDLCAGLHSWSLLGQDELAASKI